MIAGSRVGAYEITGTLGAGGMGEVYRAIDTNLGRQVAIKVLPDTFANDPERLARFEREAKTLASLNHPNIAQVYGFEKADGIPALVMELVAGPTLADRIAQGPIPVDETLPIAKQIAEALEAAHEQGIIHRDLKPANIKIRPDGTVKILDFGLAKALQPSSAGSVDVTASPTITSPAMMTGVGMLLGTAAYMSPEQARGKPVDKRADIWAFGVVLWEMVTGERLFAGEDLTETLASVVREEPQWNRVPQTVRGLLRACLEKDPKRRLRDIGDVWRLLQEDAPATATVPATARARLSWAVAAAFALMAVAALVTAAIALSRFQELASSVSPQLVRFEVPFPANVIPGGRSIPALSPDGRRLAFVANNASGQGRVFVHALDELDPRPLPGTEGAFGTPFWSADSRSVVFATALRNLAPGILKKIDAGGGPALTLTEIPSTLRGGFWTPDGTIVFALMQRGLFSVSSAGGVPRPLATVREATQAAHSYPSPLPDGRHFVYSRGVPGEVRVYIRSLDDAPESDDPAIVDNASNAIYAPSRTPGSGYVLFVRDGTLMALPFDEATLQPSGEPLPVAQDVGQGPNDPQFRMIAGSSNGTLVYLQEGFGRNRRLTWYDRRGATLATIGDAAEYTAGALAIAPDGSKVAVAVRDENRSDLWIYDMRRGGRTRITGNAATNWAPFWSPDASRIAFTSSRTQPAGIYLKSLNGSGAEEMLHPGGGSAAWSHDGRYLLSSTGRDLWVFRDLGKAGSAPIQITAPGRKGFVGGARFSPDGRWIAHQSDQSGEDQVFVRPFDPSDPARTATAADVQVSTGTGTAPRWGPDGRELFYLSERTVMAVTITTQPSLQIGAPVELFQLPLGTVGDSWDISADGTRFLFITGDSTPPPFTVMLNWQEALKRLVPTN